MKEVLWVFVILMLACCLVKGSALLGSGSVELQQAKRAKAEKEFNDGIDKGSVPEKAKPVVIGFFAKR